MNAVLSYWEKKHFWNYCDFAVVGSGITGITSAIFIKRLNPKARVAILERGALPAGASTRNAGFACFGSAGEILDDLQYQSESEVFDLVRKRFDGLIALRELLGDPLIEYKACGGFEVFTNNQIEQYEHVLGSLSFLNAELTHVIGRQCFWDESKKIERFGLRKMSGIIANREEGIIDTGLMMKNLIALARQEGVEIFNGVEVLSVNEQSDKMVFETKLGDLSAGFAVVATNGLAASLIPHLDVSPNRGQVLITSKIAGLDYDACFHHDRGYDYFRTVDGRILIGGGRQLNPDAERSFEFGLTDTVQNYLEGFLKEHIGIADKAQIEMRWSGIMGMGKSKSVIVEKIGPRLGVAVRFGGMGVALGTQIGKEVAEWTR